MLPLSCQCDPSKTPKCPLTFANAVVAHAMTRGIAYDTCEEVNHHLVHGKLPLSNACGQHGQSYSDDICPMRAAAKECNADSNLEVQAFVQNGGAPPFFCAPTETTPFTGYYDPLSGEVSDSPFKNEAGRMDVEGCCFWGRGILLNQGICDIGRFNYAYGLPAITDGRSSGRYKVDFCAHPEALCSEEYSTPADDVNKSPTIVDTSDIPYLLGLLYWVEHVQNYNWGYYNYMTSLKLFVDGGMKDDIFVDDFSEIVINSHRDSELRKANFKRVLEILLVEAPTASPTISPTGVPTNSPSREPTSHPTSQPSMAPVTSPTSAPVALPPEQIGGATGTDNLNQSNGTDLNSTQSNGTGLNSTQSNGTDLNSTQPNQQPAQTPTQPNQQPAQKPTVIDLSAPEGLPANTIAQISKTTRTSPIRTLVVSSCTLLVLFASSNCNS